VPNVRGEKRHPFSCPDTMWDWLAERGRALGVSRSEIVRRLIRQEQERLTEPEQAPAAPSCVPTLTAASGTRYCRTHPRAGVPFEDHVARLATNGGATESGEAPADTQTEKA
jgi:negative regulator of replication initiation